MFICLLFTVFLATVSAQAQPLEKLPRIGFLGATSAAVEKSRIEAFQQGLREAGYVKSD
jgi:hypothetical protein